MHDSVPKGGDGMIASVLLICGDANPLFNDVDPLANILVRRAVCSWNYRHDDLVVRDPVHFGAVRHFVERPI